MPVGLVIFPSQPQSSFQALTPPLLCFSHFVWDNHQPNTAATVWHTASSLDKELLEFSHVWKNCCPCLLLSWAYEDLASLRFCCGLHPSKQHSHVDGRKTQCLSVFSSSLLLSSLYLKYSHPFELSAGETSAEDHQDVQELERLPCEKRLRDWSFSSLEQGWFQGGLTATPHSLPLSAYRNTIEKMETVFV